MRKIIKLAFIIVFSLISSLTFSQNQLVDRFEQIVNEASNELGTDKPDMPDPVKVNAAVVWNKTKDKIAVVVKASILYGWHIYAFVPKTAPYLKSKLILEIPDHVVPISDWQEPVTFLMENNVYIYQGDIVFIRYFSINKKTKGDEIKTGLFYQTCDLKQCLPPQSKTIQLSL